MCCQGAGQSDQCWSFPIDGSLIYLHSAAITRGVTFAIFFEKSWRDSHKMPLVAILVENPGNSIEKSDSMLGMGSEQLILVINSPKPEEGKPSYFDFVQDARMPQ